MASFFKKSPLILCTALALSVGCAQPMEEHSVDTSSSAPMGKTDQVDAESDWTDLHERVSELVKENKVDDLRTMLGEHALDLNVPNPIHKFTLIFDAISIEAAELLIEHGADPHYVESSWGNNLVTYWVNRRHLNSTPHPTEYLRWMLEQGVSPTHKTRSLSTALHLVMHNAYPSMPNYDHASLLFEYGADPNAFDYRGYTPLTYAAVNLYLSPESDENSYSKRIFDLLLDNGADVNAFTDAIDAEYVSYDDENMDGHTPLTSAVTHAYARHENIKFLLEAGADPNLKTSMAKRPPLYYLTVKPLGDNLPTLDLLIEHGADVDAQEDVKGRTTLMAAAIKGQSELVQHLLYHDADVDLEDHAGRTVLHHAAAHGEAYIAFDLMDAFAHPDARDNDGYTPLFAALAGSITNRGDFYETLKILLDMGADAESTIGEARKSVLMYAATLPSEGAALFSALLLENHVYIDQQDANGDTFLHHTLRQRPDVTLEILEAGYSPDIHLANHEGVTPLELARQLSEEADGPEAVEMWDTILGLFEAIE